MSAGTVCYARPVAWAWWPCFLATQVALHLRHRVRLVKPARRPRGPLVIVSKHCHYWDIPALGKASMGCAGESISFEMARFDGYAVLGLLQHVFLPLGGFPVMRPKDALRLKKRGGLDAAGLREAMREQNEAAVQRRAAILRGGAVYAFFPEGTRDPARLREFRSLAEIAEAVAMAETEGIAVEVMPVALNYGPRRAFPRRRALEIRCGEPYALAGLSPAEGLGRARAFLEEAWRPPTADGASS